MNGFQNILYLKRVALVCCEWLFKNSLLCKGSPILATGIQIGIIRFDYIHRMS